MQSASETILLHSDDNVAAALADLPANPCSVTGESASGATLVTFTTGRRSASGYMPMPCFKPATNPELYARMSEDMDGDCGDVATGASSLEEKGEEIFELFLRVASGQRTKRDTLGLGGVKFVPWQIGATM